MSKFIYLLSIIMLCTGCGESEADRAARLEKEKQKYIKHMEDIDLLIEKKNELLPVSGGLQNLYELLLGDSVPHFTRQTLTRRSEREELIEALSWESEDGNLFNARGVLNVNDITSGYTVSLTEIYSEFEAEPLILNVNTVLMDAEAINDGIHTSFKKLLKKSSHIHLRHCNVLFDRLDSGTWNMDGDDTYQDGVRHITHVTIDTIAKLKYAVLVKTISEDDARMEGKDMFMTGHIVQRFAIYDLLKQETVGSFFIYVENSDELQVSQYGRMSPEIFTSTARRNLESRMSEEIETKLFTALVEDVE